MLLDRRQFMNLGVATAANTAVTRTIPLALVQFDAVPEQVGRTMLVTNRVGQSWLKQTPGASAVFAASGDVLARANQDGKEEILRHDLRL